MIGKIICSFALILTGLGLFGQNSPMQYLSHVPKYTGNPCNVSDADINNLRIWREDIVVFLDSLSADIDRRSEAMDAFMEMNEDQIRENILTQQGYSKEDARRLENADDMSEAEKEAIANNMLMEKMGMDINDLKKLAEMDTAAQKRWAQGYGTMIMAESMANPEQSEQEQKQIRNQIELVNEQQFMIEKIRAAEWKYFQQFDTLQKEADDAEVKMNAEIRDWNKRRENCTNPECQQEIDETINRKYYEYCCRFTPKYIKIVAAFRAYVEGSLNDYDALDVINNKVTESQTGIRNTAFKPGLSALSLVKGYADKEASVFQFFRAKLLTGVGAE